MRLPVVPVKGDEKWEILSKIVDKLEKREAKKALARHRITPAVSEVNKRYELRKFLRIGDEIKLRSITGL